MINLGKLEQILASENPGLNEHKRAWSPSAFNRFGMRCALQTNRCCGKRVTGLEPGCAGMLMWKKSIVKMGA